MIHILFLFASKIGVDDIQLTLKNDNILHNVEPKLAGRGEDPVGADCGGKPRALRGRAPHRARTRWRAAWRSIQRSYKPQPLIKSKSATRPKNDPTWRWRAGLAPPPCTRSAAVTFQNSDKSNMCPSTLACVHIPCTALIIRTTTGARLQAAATAVGSGARPPTLNNASFHSHSSRSQHLLQAAPTLQQPLRPQPLAAFAAGSATGQAAWPTASAAKTPASLVRLPVRALNCYGCCLPLRAQALTASAAESAPARAACRCAP